MLGVQPTSCAASPATRRPRGKLARELADAETRARDLDQQAGARPTDEAGYVGVCAIASAAGGGALVEDERITGRVKFRRRWLARRGLVAGECRLIWV